MYFVNESGNTCETYEIVKCNLDGPPYCNTIMKTCPYIMNIGKYFNALNGNFVVFTSFIYNFIDYAWKVLFILKTHISLTALHQSKYF